MGVTIQPIPHERLPIVYLVYLVPAAVLGAHYQLAVWVGEWSRN